MNEITYQQTPVGPRWAIGTIGFISLDNAPGFNDPELRSRLTGLTAVYNAESQRLQPDHVAPAVREAAWSGVVRGGARKAFDAGLAFARDAREADLRRLEPAQPVDAAFAKDVWESYRAMDREGRMRAFEAADLSELTALHQYGNRVPLSPEEAAPALARYRVENLMVAQNVAAGHPAVATVETPLVIGPDMAAARQQVEEWEKSHAERLEAVEANQAIARDFINFLAVVFDVPAGEVLDAIMGRDDA